VDQVQVDQKNYRMPPQDGITIAYFITVADIERSARFYEKVFGGRVLSRGDIWRSRGAEFITEPKDKYGDTRCYIRDPAGCIIEVGQSKPDFA
jgi:glyoxalase/bleomycin resistance protein/dioxygenase superfamily protein